MEELRSWRLQHILKSELAAGNSIFKMSYVKNAEELSALFVLSELFMTAIRPDKPPVSFREITTDPICFKKAYYDEETGEILACRDYQNPIKKLKDTILRRKIK